MILFFTFKGCFYEHERFTRNWPTFYYLTHLPLSKSKFIVNNGLFVQALVDFYESF